MINYIIDKIIIPACVVFGFIAVIAIIATKPIDYIESRKKELLYNECVEDPKYDKYQCRQFIY